MTKMNYKSFGSAFTFIIKVPFSESEIYYDKRLQPMIVHAIIGFEINYIRLAHKYQLGIPFHAMAYPANPDGYEKRYYDAAYRYLLAKREINFYVQSMQGAKPTYKPLVSKIYYINDNGVLVHDNLIDVDGFKTPESYSESTAIKQPPFNIFGEGYNEAIIEESQEVNELNFIMLHFGIRSNVFYPFIKDAETGVQVDNRVAAYRNAPRYNSFLRDIKILCKRYGFTISPSEEGVFYERKPHETANGILLDGKIVYQEDMEV